MSKFLLRCAWCRKFISGKEIEDGDVEKVVISDGICESCFGRIFDKEEEETETGD